MANFDRVVRYANKENSNKVWRYWYTVSTLYVVWAVAEWTIACQTAKLHEVQLGIPDSTKLYLIDVLYYWAVSIHSTPGPNHELLQAGMLRSFSKMSGEALGPIASAIKRFDSGREGWGVRHIGR